jgi:hypothetical protein
MLRKEPTGREKSKDECGVPQCRMKRKAFLFNSSLCTPHSALLFLPLFESTLSSSDGHEYVRIFV